MGELQVFKQTPSMQPFPIAWVSRDDLLHVCANGENRLEMEAKVQALDASEIELIGSKVGDRLQETYWMALDIVLLDYLIRYPESPA